MSCGSGTVRQTTKARRNEANALDAEEVHPDELDREDAGVDEVLWARGQFLQSLLMSRMRTNVFYESERSACELESGSEGLHALHPISSRAIELTSACKVSSVVISKLTSGRGRTSVEDRDELVDHACDVRTRGQRSYFPRDPND